MGIPTEEVVTIETSPAIGADGTIYFGSGDGNFYAIKPDGSLKWILNMGAFTVTSPAIGADGTIYVGDDVGYLNALSDNGTNCNFKWVFEIENIIDYPIVSGFGSSPAIGADGTIYIGSYDYSMYALTDNGSSCSEKWDYPTKGAD